MFHFSYDLAEERQAVHATFSQSPFVDLSRKGTDQERLQMKDGSIDKGAEDEAQERPWVDNIAVRVADEVPWIDLVCLHKILNRT
jgi:hypothetical protein